MNSDLQDVVLLEDVLATIAYGKQVLQGSLDYAREHTTPNSPDYWLARIDENEQIRKSLLSRFSSKSPDGIDLTTKHIRKEFGDFPEHYFDIATHTGWEAMSPIPVGEEARKKRIIEVFNSRYLEEYGIDIATPDGWEAMSIIEERMVGLNTHGWDRRNEPGWDIENEYQT